MFYNFPRIENISDVLPYIEGRKEFIVAVKEHFTVINYVVQMADTFSTSDPGWEIRRECRGIKFANDDGRILQRPLHKFFNLNEREEVRYESISWQESHNILEKLDGSMVVPIFIDDHVRWTTKMGITSVALQAETFIAKDKDIQDFSRNMLKIGITPIFEYTGPNNRIVLPYSEEKITLLALRDTITGEYLETSAYQYDILEVSPVDFVFVPERVAVLENMEGVVISFLNGHKIKCKSKWYVALHRAKDSVQREHDLVSLIVNSQLDDAKAVMDSTTKEKVEKFEKDFWKEINDFIRYIEEVTNAFRLTCLGDRKSFALKTKEGVNPVQRSFVFSLWDKKETAQEVLLRAVRKATTREINWQDFKNNTGIDLKWEGVLWTS